MPHDSKGNLLQVGDIVHMPFRVAKIYPDAKVCNVQVISTLNPEDLLPIEMRCNGRFVLKTTTCESESPAADPAEAPAESGTVGEGGGTVSGEEASTATAEEPAAGSDQSQQ